MPPARTMNSRTGKGDESWGPQEGIHAQFLENYKLSDSESALADTSALAQRVQVALTGLFQGAPPPPTYHSVLMALFLLDLSFNNIEAIEGLDTLVNLEDLSLFNNRISKIDSLDALVKLQVLSLGNNHISNMMNVSWEGRGLGWPCRGRELLGAALQGQSRLSLSQ